MAGFVTPLTSAEKAARDKARREASKEAAGRGDVHGTNTRVSLWPDRWPAIALQECIDKVEAAPPEERPMVKFGLPCSTCPESTRCLNAKRKEIGPLLYDQEILTNPRTSESSLFPQALMEKCLDRTSPLVPYWRKPFSTEYKYKVVQAWDLAWSEKIGGDWLVCMTAVVDVTTGQRRLLNIKRWQRVPFDEQVNLIGLEWTTYQADLVVIEADAAQSIWSKHIGRNTAVPVMPHTAGEKRDFRTGVPGLLILLENEKWEFPYLRGSYNFENVETFLSECEAFGWNDGKLEGVGEHDDTVMCWWHLNWGIERFLMANTGEEHRRGVQDGAH